VALIEAGSIPVALIEAGAIPGALIEAGGIPVALIEAGGIPGALTEAGAIPGALYTGLAIYSVNGICSILSAVQRVPRLQIDVTGIYPRRHDSSDRSSS